MIKLIQSAGMVGQPASISILLAAFQGMEDSARLQIIAAALEGAMHFPRQNLDPMPEVVVSPSEVQLLADFRAADDSAQGTCLRSLAALRARFPRRRPVLTLVRKGDGNGKS